MSTTNDDWLTASPAGRASVRISEIVQEVGRWRNFLPNDPALVAAQRLLIAANELMLIVEDDPKNEQTEDYIDRISKSAKSWTDKAMRALAGDVS